MTLFQDPGADPRALRERVADVLRWYGAAGDAVLGNAPNFCTRKASLARELGKLAQFGQDDCDALYLAGLLHGIGAIENPAFAKGVELSERAAKMQRWDVPAAGARVCASIEALPPATSDILRWQFECWDGTGFPDQLRWFGIPALAQMVGVADAFLRFDDPDEALGSIGIRAGRAFSPDCAHTFSMWFHLNGGEVTIHDLPVDALRDSAQRAETLLDAAADRIDAHNDVPGRWRRIERLSRATADALELSAQEQAEMQAACRMFGAGELDAPDVEDRQFDALARLAVQSRARNGNAAAALVGASESLAGVARTLRAHGEWFDGTGKPDGLRGTQIPRAAAVINTAIAYDRLDRKARLDEAAGTMLDPHVVRATLASAKASA